MRLLFALAVLSLPVPAWAGWDDVATPAPGPAEVIGSYANGCLKGAVALPQAGEGFEVVRRGRNRYWVHPDAIGFVEDFGRRLKQAGLEDALVADTTQPRGGPMPGGHGSHQSGLDLDVWFRPGPLPAKDRAFPWSFSVVEKGGARVDGAVWNDSYRRLIAAAAKAPKVERIFVNPAIKQHLCESVAADERDWLGKVRPWWGHDSHFHVRLACPAGSPDCTPQDPVPQGDGCDETLAWWFTAEATTPKPRTKEKPPLPERCQAVLKE